MQERSLFEKKVFHSFLLTIVIIVGGFGIIVSAMIYEILLENELRTASELIEATDSSLEFYLESVEREVLYLITNTSVQELITDNTESVSVINSYALAGLFDVTVTSQYNWDSIIYYANDSLYTSSTIFHNDMYYDMLREMIDDIDEENKNYMWKVVEKEDVYASDNVLVYCRKVYDYSSIYRGILVVNIPCSSLMDFFPKEEITNFEILFSNSEGDIIAQAEESRYGDATTLDEITGNLSSKMYVTTETKFAGINMTIVLQREYISEKIAVIFSIFIIMILAITFLAFVWVSHLTKKLLMPITRIERVVDQVSDGNYETQIDTIEESALGKLSVAINKMVREIKELLEYNITIEKNKRFLELNYIQLQMNPHFLYNSLESVCGMVYEEQNDAIHMINSISKFYRNVLSNGDTYITVRQELEIVDKYLEVMEYRTKDLFSYEIECSQQVSNYRVIKLILQPLVENCIEHAFVNKRSQRYNVCIRIKEEDSGLRIEVIDDGIELTEGAIAEINDKINVSAEGEIEHSNGGFALRNIATRLKLHFGQESKLYFGKNEGIGSIVTIIIPISDETMNEK